MSREAMKLALEALETLHDENMDYLTRNKLGGENNQCMVFAREAITALREALAEQPAQQALDKKAENARELGLDYEPSSVSKLAREAGIRNCTCNGTLGCLERFAELARADEREACAKLCDARAAEYDGFSAEQNASEKLATAIRARSNT